MSNQNSKSKKQSQCKVCGKSFNNLFKHQEMNKVCNSFKINASAEDVQKQSTLCTIKIKTRSSTMITNNNDFHRLHDDTRTSKDLTLCASNKRTSNKHQANATIEESMQQLKKKSKMSGTLNEVRHHHGNNEATCNDSFPDASYYKSNSNTCKNKNSENLKYNEQAYGNKNHDSSIDEDDFNENNIEYCNEVSNSIPSEENNVIDYNRTEQVSMSEQRQMIISDPLEKSMAKLYQMCDESGNSRPFCDNLLDEICKLINNKIFDPTTHQRKRRNAYMKRYQQILKFDPPSTTLITIFPKKTLDVITFNAFQAIQRYLLSEVYSHIENLVVDSNNHWSPPLPDNYSDYTGELGMSKWAIETYESFKDSLSKSSDTETIDDYCFCPIILYTDKTGTDLIEKNSLEPVVATMGLLKNSVWESHKNWMILGFIPNQHVTSSAQRKKESQATKHRSMVCQTHHLCMEVILNQIKLIQQEQPVLKFRRGNLIKQKKIYCPIAFIAGDNLSQDVQSGRVSNKSKTSSRMTRRCLTPFHEASVVPHICRMYPIQMVKYLSMSALGPLYEKNDVSNSCYIKRTGHNNNNWQRFLENQPNKSTRELYGRALKLCQKVCDGILHKVLGTHSVDNAFDELDLGVNTLGIHGATVSDILHSVDSGITPYFIAILVGQMTNGQKSQIDSFVEELFCKGKNRSSQRKEYPRVGYTRGFSSLSLLSAEGKRGILFVCSILHQLRQGRKILSSRYHSSFDKNGKKISNKFVKEVSTNAFDDEKSYESIESVIDDREKNKSDTVTNLTQERIEYYLEKLGLKIVSSQLLPILSKHHQVKLWNVLKMLLTQKNTVFLNDIEKLNSNIVCYKNIDETKEHKNDETGHSDKKKNILYLSCKTNLVRIIQ